MVRLLISLLFIVLFAGSAAASRGKPAAVPSVAPVFLQGSPDCSELGFPSGADFLIDGPGGRRIELPTGSLAFETDGILLDWSATSEVMGVVVEGSPNVLHYRYHPQRTALSDRGLHAPLLEDGSPSLITRITFCFDGVGSDRTSVGEGRVN
jgi:hypothetical protein